MIREKADKILQALERGASLRKAAADVGLSHTSVLQWVDEIPEFADQYARARLRGYQLLADELIDIADTPMVGEVRTVRQDGSEEVKYADMIEHRRLRIDSRKWMLSKMLPKVYGDKTTIAGDPDHPLVVISPTDARL